MANLSQYISGGSGGGATPSGGGGGGFTLPGSETITEGTQTYRNIITTGMISDFYTYTGNGDGGDGTGFFRGIPTAGLLAGKVGHASVTSAASSNISEIVTSTNNNVYTTAVNNTGSGIFWWGSMAGFQRVSITNASTGTRTGSMTVSIRVTIDGGTAQEIVSPITTLTSPSATANDFAPYASIYTGIPVVRNRELSETTGNNIARAYLNEDDTFVYPKSGFSYGANDEFQIPVRDLSTNTPRPVFMTAPQCQFNGIPGIRYESSLLIEVRYNAATTGSWNVRNGGFAYDFCITEF